MIKCRICRAENREDSQFCDECGAMMMEKQNETETPNFKTQMIESPVFQPGNVTSIGMPSIVEVIKAEDSAIEPKEKPKLKGAHASLTIERGESAGTEFGLTANESFIGRWDADNGVFPDVDLDAHDPEAKVSRRHARILHKDGQYAIEDLGSTNGTFLNRGRRLIPGSAQLLNDGDEIIVGKTFLRFAVNK